MAARNVGAKQLAYLFNVSERRVQQLAAEGIITKEGRGRYNLTESIRGYIMYLQDGTTGTEPAGESLYKDARDQKMRADADKSIMETAMLAGSLIPVDIVTYQWNHMIGAFRAKLLNLGKKLAPQVQHETTFRKCQSAIQAGVHECLAELSDYEPPEKHFDNIDQFIAGATPRIDGKPMGGSRKKTVKRK